MEYYALTKTDTINRWIPTIFKGGYTFSQKLHITIYDFNMIRYILIKKLNNSLKGIINLYLLYTESEEDSDENIASLLPKIETLRAILIEKYAAYLQETEIEAYLMKLDRLAEKVDSRIFKRTRTK